MGVPVHIYASPWRTTSTSTRASPSPPPRSASVGINFALWLARAMDEANGLWESPTNTLSTPPPSRRTACSVLGSNYSALLSHLFACQATNTTCRKGRRGGAAAAAVVVSRPSGKGFGAAVGKPGGESALATVILYAFLPFGWRLASSARYFLLPKFTSVTFCLCNEVDYCTEEQGGGELPTNKIKSVDKKYNF